MRGREARLDSGKEAKQGRQGIVFEKEKKVKKESEKEGGVKLEPGAAGTETGKQGESAGVGADPKREGEARDGELLKIHLSACRAPHTAMAKGREMEWKKMLRSKVEAALKKADPGAQSSVLGTSYHFSRRNE